VAEPLLHAAGGLDRVHLKYSPRLKNTEMTEAFYNMLGILAIILAVFTLGLGFLHIYTSVKTEE
jgi:hypothetical protein